MHAFLNCAAVAMIAAAAFANAPSAGAEEPDVYGLLTEDEKQEIWENGWKVCVALDQAYEAAPPPTSDDVKVVVDRYLGDGWDLESAGDIVWESVEGGCADYMPQLEIAMRSYSPSW